MTMTGKPERDPSESENLPETSEVSLDVTENAMYHKSSMQISDYKKANEKFDTTDKTLNSTESGLILRLDQEPHERPCISKRYVVAILSFFGFFNVYCLRVDLSIAIVAMTNNHTRLTLKGEEYEAIAEFDWDSRLQGHILGSFYYGYLVTQIPGGYIAARFGGANLFGGAILVTSLLTLLTPAACRLHVMLLILLRVIEGFCEGCIYPCMYALWSRWAPPMERSKLTTIPHAGSYLGSVVGTLFSGFLCELAGWSFVFYMFGMLGIIWSIIWVIIVADSPAADPNITARERQYIEDSLKDEHTAYLVTGNPPWMKFFTSLPFMAILVAHTSEGWGFSTMQTSLPKYFTEAHNIRISSAGVYSSTLYFVMGVSVFIGGQLADAVRQQGTWSITSIRKIFTCTGFALQASAFVISVHLENVPVGVAVLIIGGGLEGLAWAGFAVNHLDLAPRYSSILFGITNTCATIPGILSPLFVGYVAVNKTIREWRVVFYIGSVTFLIGSIFYGLFASAEKQNWDDSNDNGAYSKLIDDEHIWLKQTDTQIDKVKKKLEQQQ